jgi:hypothetical protein
MLKYRAHLLKRLLRHNVSHPKTIVPDFTFSDSLSGHFQGSVFVTDRARAFVDGLLRNTKFAGDIDNITRAFDNGAKLAFRSIAEPGFIKFGGARDRDPKLNIRSGQLKLDG